MQRALSLKSISPRCKAGLGWRYGLGGGCSVSRKASMAATCSFVGAGPNIVFVKDFFTLAPRSGWMPCQVHGSVCVTLKSDGVNLGVPYESSLSVSKFRPLVWPSTWQVWQL